MWPSTPEVHGVGLGMRRTHFTHSMSPNTYRSPSTFLPLRSHGMASDNTAFVRADARDPEIDAASGYKLVSHDIARVQPVTGGQQNGQEASLQGCTGKGSENQAERL